MAASISERAAWLESQYNNRTLVPEHPQILARWAADSAAVRQGAGCQVDLAYGDAHTERLDLFAPAGGCEGAPVLVFIHGGWWRALDKSDHSFIAPAFTAAGCVVVVPNYALCPAVTVEHIALQMVRAVAWTWRHIRIRGGDPGHIVVAGHSAGGQLAALLLKCLWQQVDAGMPAQALRAAVALSGVFDMEPLRQTPFLQKDLKLTRASANKLSPARLPPPAAPLLALAGAEESSEFQRQRLLIRSAWGEAAVPLCEAVPACNHFTVLDELARAGSRVHGAVLDALRRP